MELLRYILLVSVYLALSACDSVTANKPLGLPIWYEMQGLWTGEIYNNFFYLDVRLLADGSLRTATINWDKEKQEYEFAQSKLVVSVEDGVHYLNTLDGFVDPLQYSFFRIIISEGGIMTAFAPDIDKFEAAIQSGTLTGTVNKTGFTSQVQISDSEQLAKYIDPAKFAEQFNINRPISMRRIYKYPMPEDVSTVLDQAKHNHSQCLSIGMKEDVGFVIFTPLTQAAFNAYNKCMQDREYEFTPDDPSSEMYIVKNGLGLFTFRITIKE